MTSMLDQYERASQRSKPSGPEPMRPDISTSGFIQMKSQDEEPIFIRQRVNFRPPDNILHLAVSSNFIMIVMANNIILRIDVKCPEKKEEIDISKYVTNMKISGLFLDPLGNHLLIALIPKNGESPPPDLFYLHRTSTKLKQVCTKRKKQER